MKEVVLIYYITDVEILMEKDKLDALHTSLAIVTHVALIIVLNAEVIDKEIFVLANVTV